MAKYDLPGKTILLHNRCGIRIELNFDGEGRLVLWISPQAGTSLSYRDRNFSCRDDHTSIFDKITLPGLTAESFVSCDYDPFYCRIRFKRQKIHLLNVFDKPAIRIWFERPQIIDVKSDKQDRAVLRTSTTFSVEHPDRDRNFLFVIMTNHEKKTLIHQQCLDRGRSVYCRVSCGAGQHVVIAGELLGEPVLRWCREALAIPAERCVDTNEKMIERSLLPGTFVLNGLPRFQKLLERNRRVLLSMQDLSGAIRAAINRIYYLIWVRDGAIIECFNAYAGSAGPLKKWAAFLLNNPLEVKEGHPRGTTFGQLVNQITKIQEDGVFYAVWSAFNDWTQRNDRVSVTGKRLKTLEDAMTWLEKYAFERKTGLFGRFYACETPLAGSRDDGFDNAVGMPVAPGGLSFNGQPVRRSFDVYINLLCHSSYVMLAAMTERRKSDLYLDKAAILERKMKEWFDETARQKKLPPYGRLLTDNGMADAPAYGLDKCDYVWAFSLPPFLPFPHVHFMLRELLFDDMRKKPSRYFLAGYCSVLSSLDIEYHSEEEIIGAMQYAARQCFRPGTFLAMPGTVVEMLDVRDGDLYHDVRPQAFSIGPWLAAVAGLGVRRLPYGLAVRPSMRLRAVSSYEYKSTHIDFVFTGTGRRCLPVVNGVPVPGSLQIPEKMFKKGRNRIEIRREQKDDCKPVLVSSTIRLDSISCPKNGVRYEGEAFGKNILVFRTHEKEFAPEILLDKRDVPFTCTHSDRWAFVEFWGKGAVCCNVDRR